MKILAIGNSFTYPILNHLTALAKAAGVNVVVGRAIRDGSSLQFHVTAAEAFDKDPQDQKGRPYPNNASLDELLRQEQWDYVTMQQVSGSSFDVNSFRPWAKKLHDYIKARAPKAEVVLHQTWAYRDDDPLFVTGKLTPEGMYRRVREAYDAIAAELECRVVRVGDAFWMVRQTPGWEYDPAWTRIDPKTYEYPAVPKQTRSLQRGWRWSGAEGARRLINDTHHASVAGMYLGACVWFEFFFGRCVVGNAHLPEEISRADAAFLQEIAHKIVADNARPDMPAAP